MKALLMHPDRDLEPPRPEPGNAADLCGDLELDTILDAMAAGDKLILEVARAALLHPLQDRDAIRYRQAALADCLANPETVRELYAFALAARRADRGVWGFWGGSPETTLASSRHSLQALIERAHDLRAFADEHRSRFASEAFTRLFEMLAAELSEEYFALVEQQLQRVELKHGTLISARLGPGNRGAGYVLRLGPELGWRERLTQLRHPAHGFSVHPRDEASLRALSELRGRALNEVANALAQASDHIKRFFTMLATELAFYVGALNLHDRLVRIGATTSVPGVAGFGAPRLAARGLYDVALALALATERRAVGNDIDADGGALIVVTGANQGGKSTFLRSLGQAQLMMQAGIFVGADRFSADLRDRVFTHHRREEEASMERGKLDEELARMSAIVQEISPRSLLLANESFASTNEREGSEIARQVVRALREAGVKIVFVTHLFDFADAIRLEARDDVLFLRAPRGRDGSRPYKLEPAPPQPTSHARDTYKAIFAPAQRLGWADADRHNQRTAGSRDRRGHG